MTLRIGNKEVIKQSTFLIPQNESAETSVSIDELDMIVRVSYMDDGSGNPQFKWTLKDNTFNLNLINCDNPLGTGTDEPAEIGKNHLGRTLFMMLASWRVGNVNKIDLQFMVG